MSSTPRGAASAVELFPQLPPGEGERFTGSGVMGLPFGSGWCLALRCWEATTIGPPYRAVYVRDPAGAWTIQTTAPPDQSCPRYLSAAAAEVPSPRPIEVTWIANDTIHVGMDGELDWTFTLGDSLATRMMRTAGAAMPDGMWTNNGVLTGVGAIAGPVLHAGRVRLHGSAPNGQWFQAVPTLVWPVIASTATWRGTDLGDLGPLSPQTHLADLWLPQRGLFYVGTATFERRNGTHLRPAVAA